MVAGVIQKSVVTASLPESVFFLLYGSGRETGTTLVQHPQT
jgi:hypothetical protein